MTPDHAHAILRNASPLDVGRFYGAKDNLALGAGLIYEKVLTPLFSEKENLYVTARQPVYVLTHECDVDQANQRPFNDYVAFCPVIPLEAFIKRYEQRWSDEAKLKAFLANVASREVGRVVYLPSSDPALLQFGGLVYLSGIASCHISAFKDQDPVAALSEYGLRELDLALRNSLFREKAEPLSFSYGLGR